MDIQHLVDRLEDLIDEGRHIPMTKMTVIDEERALEIIDQMRISVPEEVDKASRILNQKDRLLAQANEEAARIIEIAKDKAETLIARDAIVQAAQNRASNIIEQARQDADNIRGDADTYVVGVLNELESHLIKTLTVVRNGISKIQQDREASKQRVENAVQQALGEMPQVPTPAVAAVTLPQPKPSDSKLPEDKAAEKVEARVDMTVDAS
jgi:vacuolar-type H+-ATPase subunit H